MRGAGGEAGMRLEGLGEMGSVGRDEMGWDEGWEGLGKRLG